MDSSTTSSDYILGHTEEELIRLERQAEIFGDATEDILRQAGIRPGMRVLDIGCGVGDVSLVAARLVGPTGEITGIDRSDDALATARQRADLAGLDWLSFKNADITALGAPGRFDAVIGRFILMHLADPAAILRDLKRNLRPNGLMAFIEMDIRSAAAEPPMALFTTCLGWIISLYQRAGIEPDMGSKLYGAFRGAGMTPALIGSCRIEAGRDATAYTYIAETLRSLLPSLEKLDIATPSEVAVDTLADRLRATAEAAGTCFIFPRFIGAWAHIGP